MEQSASQSGGKQRRTIRLGSIEISQSPLQEAFHQAWAASKYQAKMGGFNEADRALR
jgi:hypothetical protein